MALGPCHLPLASNGGLARPASSRCGDGLRAKADLSLNAKVKPVAYPVSLSVLACNYCLPRYLQVFPIDGVGDGNVLEASGACVNGVWESREVSLLEHKSLRRKGGIVISVIVISSDPI